MGDSMSWMQWVVEGAKATVEALALHDPIGSSEDR